MTTSIKAILNVNGQVIGAIMAHKGQISTSNGVMSYRLSASRKAIKEAKQTVAYDGLWVEGEGFVNAKYRSVSAAWEDSMVNFQ